MKRVRFENDDVVRSTPKACYCCLNVKAGILICATILIFKMLFDLVFSIDAFFFEHIIYFQPVRASASTFFNLIGVIPLFVILLHVHGSSQKHWYTMTWLIYNAIMILANIIYIPVCDPLNFDFNRIVDIVYEVHLMVTVLFFIWSTIVAMMYYRMTRDGVIVKKRQVKKSSPQCPQVDVNEKSIKKDLEGSSDFHYEEIV